MQVSFVAAIKEGRGDYSCRIHAVGENRDGNVPLRDASMQSVCYPARQVEFEFVRENESSASVTDAAATHFYIACGRENVAVLQQRE